MRKLMIAAFLANVVLAVASLFVLPGQVAIHFGLGGRPGSWASREVNTLIFLAMDGVCLALFILVPGLMFKVPRSMIHLPHKDYWFREENLPEARARYLAAMDRFGAAFFAFMFLVLFLVIQANLSSPVRLDERLFFPALAAYLLYAAYWCLDLYRSFRVPGDK